MKKVSLIFLTGLILLGSHNIRAQDGDAHVCGKQPIPRPGCRIGRCLEAGYWEEICDYRYFVSCGPRPIPAPGCFITRCGGSGSWFQLCDDGISYKLPRCGPVPRAGKGCRLKGCSYLGRWVFACSNVVKKKPKWFNL